MSRLTNSCEVTTSKTQKLYNWKVRVKSQQKSSYYMIRIKQAKAKLLWGNVETGEKARGIRSNKGDDYQLQLEISSFVMLLYHSIWFWIKSRHFSKLFVLSKCLNLGLSCTLCQKGRLFSVVWDFHGGLKRILFSPFTTFTLIQKLFWY